MQRKYRKSYSQAERAEYREAKRTEQRERFEQSVAELATSEGWKRWVESRSLFHKYSLNNTLLIAMQRPDATMVASYNAWKRAGRQVVKGSKGIAIVAPCPIKQRSEAQTGRMAESVRLSRKGLGERPGSIGAPAEEPDGGVRMAFKAVHVFDVSQTDGQDLPELDRQPIEGDSHGDYLPKLEAFAGTIGYRVEYRDLSDHPAGGWCNHAESLIVVDSSGPVNAQVRIIVHELAHGLGIGYKDYGRELAEVIVETAAVIVCGSIGLDTSGESVPYVAGWANGDVAKIREYAGTVDEVARKLEDGVGIDELALYSDASEQEAA